MPRAEIPITDEFDSPDGRLTNYDSYDTEALAVILGQRHIDIRSFVHQSHAIESRTMFILDQLTMTDLGDWEGGFTMDELDGTGGDQKLTQLLPNQIEVFGENWTPFGAMAMTVGPDPVLGGRSCLQVGLLVGNNFIDSSIGTVEHIPTVDIADTEPTDHFSIALPDFPLSAIDLAESHVDVSFDPEGSNGVDTDRFTLDESDVPLVEGHSEFRVPRSALTGDGSGRTVITGITFKFVATAEATVRVAAIRILAPDWEYLPLGVDTYNEILRPVVSRTGSPDETHARTWPILWRAATPSGVHDPRPVNARMAASFSSGSLTPDGASSANRIALYFRETAKDYMTQLDLDGMTQEELEALGSQPDLGEARYQSRTQDDLQGLTQDDLQGDTQFDLERKPDVLASSWIRVLLSWGSAATRLALDDSEGNGYVWEGLSPLEANARYALLVDLEDDSARIRVYPLTSGDQIDHSALTFDTSLVVDDGLLARRQGRVGWDVNLIDGDATVEAVRSRGLVFAEWLSLPFESPTPVDGAQLFAGCSAPRQLYTGVEPNPFSSPEESTYFELDTDHERTTSGESVRVTNPGDKSLQGIQTNELAIENFAQTVIKFNVWYPTSPIALGAYLVSDRGALYELELPRLAPNQWQTVTLDLKRLADEQTGTFRMTLLQHEPGYPTTWWFDSASVYERSVSWAARSVLADPWGDDPASFVEFGDLTNDELSGALFGRRGRYLQVRGRGHRQSSWIDSVRFKPRYAQLGRLVWDDEALVVVSPTATFSTSSSGGVVTFDGTASSVSQGWVASYAWSLGDGEVRYGPVVQHDYEVPGNYVVTLTVTSDKGQTGSVTQIVAG